MLFVVARKPSEDRFSIAVILTGNCRAGGASQIRARMWLNGYSIVSRIRRRSDGDAPDALRRGCWECRTGNAVNEIEEVFVGHRARWLGSAPTLAADLAARPYTKAPALAAVYDWTGFYIGVNAGVGIGRDRTQHDWIRPGTPYSF